MARKPDTRDEKVQALREQGVLNPKPEAVRDERFWTNEFFDPLDLVQVKYEMVRRVREEGEPVTETATRFGQSRPTFYEAERRVKEEGLAGLVPKRPGPKGPHKLTDEVMAAVEARREEEPGLSSEELAAYVEERFGVSVHPRSIERALERRKKKRGKRG
jgi:transposase